jgi:hypothetical protein
MSDMDGRQGHAMTTQCTSCGAKDEHLRLATDPLTYRYSIEATPLLKDRLGRDIWFRQRLRECASCGELFYTAELDRDFLIDLLESWQELISENDRLRRLRSTTGTRSATREIRLTARPVAESAPQSQPNQ